MMQFTPQDHEFMQLALDLAAKGQFTATPNPSVGCVLVKDRKIVGQGFHFRAGEPHAEVMALAEAGENAKGATAYVSLEPCAHFGRTPPCAQALVNAGVKKVIAAMQDPNPQVAGKGLRILNEAGIESAVGLLQQKAEALNKGFLKRMRTGTPFVQLKMAITIDGKTATSTGESKWITGEVSRSDVQKERAKASAVLSASGTVLVDDPALNVRWEQLPTDIQAEYAKEDVRQPVRIIMDSQHRVRPYHKLFQTPSPVWLVSSKPRDISLFPDFCEAIELQIAPNQTQLQALMLVLGERQINTLWVEAGAT
ncbi:MAG TPA: bifunctional diaminohydroxyphosphoribosylaminopyrimidine deaminase/5-amino-6-(5-phosphoribosylamino)uracil reductase RibD [Pasteurellaceae bacterium]|nr:bifunctional diaminohydroxyphosphoribosylaminopyrimidine deaminase/5-amino-6-(5-phosphoribosylamino)uracil reductase RibD [Pasteurellaceae bacterium]